MNRHLLRFIGAAILAIALSPEANTQKISFPSDKSQTKSPNGRYVIRNEDFPDRDPAHRLSLLDLKSKAKSDFYEYGRHVDVLWSPRSDAFVVNDYEGSNLSTAVLFTPPLTASKIDLGRDLDNYLHSSHAKQDPFNNLHIYFTVERWLDERRLLCKLWGYGEVNPRGFTKHFVYEVGKGFREIQNRK